MTAAAPSVLDLLLAAILAVLALLVHRRRGAAGTASDILPATPGGRRAFLPFAIAAGAGWEILHRGFLMFRLAPRVGVAAGVVIAATAYALSHRAKDARQLAGAFASAMLFTAGYALTGNLWWAILVHAGLALTALLARPDGGAAGDT